MLNSSHITAQNVEDTPDFQRPRSSSYDSLNLEELTLETDEAFLFDFDNERGIFSKTHSEDPLNYGTRNIFKTTSSEDDDGLNLGIDPEFTQATRSGFLGKRSREFNIVLVA